MPANKHKYLHINLLPKDAFAQSGVGKFLNWALSTGRYIVIFTEMIVILTFLSRFTLDRQLTDLNETILNKQAVLESYSNIEAITRNIQAKAQFIEELEGQVSTVDLLDFLASQAPDDVIFEQLDVKTDRFSLIAVAYSSESLEDFINTLKAQEDRFSDVILDKITTTEKSVGINFTVTANFNNPDTNQESTSNRRS